MDKKFKLKKFRKYKNGSTFKFEYIGTSNNAFNQEEAIKMIDSFLNENISHSNMLRNIECIRTILKDTDEKSLVLAYSDSNYKEIVKYYDGSLVLFECEQYTNENLIDMEISYISKYGLKVNFPNFEDDFLIECPQVETTNDKFKKVKDYIDSLRKVRFVYLNNDSKRIIEAYKLFYNENPDFSKEDINIKMQTMMSILTKFDSNLGCYEFNYSEEMPISYDLLQSVNRLFPLGEVIVDDFVDLLEQRTKKIIKIVGETIREKIGNEVDINEALITISKIIYVGGYAGLENYNAEELEKNTEYGLNEIDINIQLLKEIQNKVNDNK